MLNAFAWKPPFVPARIEDLLSAALAQHMGATGYPGDLTPSVHWPGVAPGRLGPVNALAALYHPDPLAFTRIPRKPPILWVRGADDRVISDASLVDMGTLGQRGVVPGWPGAAVFPPQPMIAQTEAALAVYEAGGGRVTRVVLPDCGHAPYLEQPGTFDRAFHAHLAA